MSSDLSHTHPSIAELREKWLWFLGLGLVFIVLGTVAFFNVVVATVASVYFVGVMMIVGGAIQIVQALGVKSWGGFLMWLLSGVVYTAAGVLAFANPLLAAGVLTLILAIALVAGGLMRIAIGLKERPAHNWGWIVAAGALTLLAGLVIAVGWPVNSLWILGMFLAIDLVFQGWSFVAFGLALKAGQRQA